MSCDSGDPESVATRAKRQMSLTSDASDLSDESELPFTGILTPMTPNCMSPTDTKFNFNLTAQPSRLNRKSISRQETMTSMRSHSSRV